MKSRLLWALPLTLFILLGAFFWRGLSLNPKHLPSVLIDRPAPDFSLPGLLETDSALSLNELRGAPALLVVWASWCAACADEQPTLLRLAQDGVRLFGLNYKDTREDATRFLAQFGNPFLRTGFDVRGRVALEFGVYGAPEIFLTDRNGIIRYRHTGSLSPAVWQNVLQPVYESLLKEGEA
ncbi:cytochrome C biogenesis protein [Legionella geestiana]|uniref:Cytochrome C biogenesis protein n=1 Tax=Legionella geestiana TaxID=45065 RepID=A0A0W0UAM0_9GAMM|nr:DsbE family thiol:disulfide interchange protein [Legionella geestiana]KTD04849.1 cytochrome C biogenesis protein [Legionella geestiana]QBS11324.1 DsbE family thiol:disulfide interchange protein [Legionella geestiana]QDQ41018.1 DsbE family thiol:disulfide interchange protein [Legionella geestiana]STX54037.1 cytochrome c biogenesis protein CcmG, thiol-disulfide interchange protein DsbE [Legionella geestiana]